ncbi:MAG: hypothetical protein RLZZ234_69 [Candidatus Parcubacteria bacterium]|jgi:hypothetical protein
MIHTVKAVRILQTVACIVGMSVVLWSLGIPTFIRDADAASLTSVSDTISDSDRGVPANHTIRFTTPTGTISGESITITFPAQFTVNGTGATGLDFSDIDVTDDGNEITLAGSPSGTTWGVSTTTSSITLTTSTTSGASVASSSVIVIEIGTHATNGTTGDTRITNPSSAGSYEITVGGNMQDSGATRVAIIDDVVVTASVDTVFSFTISGVATSSSVNGSATTTAGSSTATAIPFGNLTAGTTTIMAQDLQVSTNATQGFVVTVEQSQNLQSSTGADIDGFINGAYTNTPTAWTAPSALLANPDTWGHWGLTSEDDLNGTEFGTDLWVAASTTPRQVFQHNGPADGVTANSGSTRVGYQVQISPLQEAGDDYTTTLTYIATPTF